MKRVGFHGGSSIFEVGSASDMECFFSLIRNVAGDLKDNNIFTDRLYRRYIRQSDIDEFESGIKILEHIFSNMEVSAELLEKIGLAHQVSSLNIDFNNMADVFQDYFRGIEHCFVSAKVFYADWGVLKPLRVVFTEMPWYLEDKNRPLADYDELGNNAIPFWLR